MASTTEEKTLDCLAIFISCKNPRILWNWAGSGTLEQVNYFMSMSKQLQSRRFILSAVHGISQVLFLDLWSGGCGEGRGSGETREVITGPGALGLAWKTHAARTCPEVKIVNVNVLESFSSVHFSNRYKSCKVLNSYVLCMYCIFIKRSVNLPLIPVSFIISAQYMYFCIFYGFRVNCVCGDGEWWRTW